MSSSRCAPVGLCIILIDPSAFGNRENAQVYSMEKIVLIIISREAVIHFYRNMSFRTLSVSKKRSKCMTTFASSSPRLYHDQVLNDDFID